MIISTSFDGIVECSSAQFWQANLISSSSTCFLPAWIEYSFASSKTSVVYSKNKKIIKKNTNVFSTNDA
jgi:hypothetical protein